MTEAIAKGSHTGRNLMIASVFALITSGCTGSGEGSYETTTTVSTSYEYTSYSEPDYSYTIEYDVYDNVGSYDSYLTLNWGYTTAYYDFHPYDDAIFIDDRARWISPGETHYSQIHLHQSGDLEIFSSGEIDLDIVIYDEYCHQVAYDDDSGYGYNFDVDDWFTPGTYYLEIYNLDHHGGYYELSAHFWPYQ